MNSTLIIELTAAAFGVLGTVLLALNGPRAGWGFVAYLVSNAGWIAFAWIQGHSWMLAQQIAFTGSSLLGVWAWLVKPLSVDWPMGLCIRLNCWADEVYMRGAGHPRLARLAYRASIAVDAVALWIYRRCKPAGMEWSPTSMRWEKHP